MSFSFSPTDLVKLGEITARVYIAFKDANGNSEAQVESLVREFKAFAECLLELAGLIEEFGNPLPFPVNAFKETLNRCEASLKPYQENLVDKKMGLTKIVWTIKYIGKEKELDFLRKQITGHYQALHMCVSFMRLRINMESTRREQRLLLEPRQRAMSLGGQWYTGAFSASTPNSPLVLPALENAHPLYKDWEIFYRWLKAEEERDEVYAQPSSWEETPAPDRGGNQEMAAARRLLRCGVVDAIFLAENRLKREAVEQRSHLAPSDAIRRQVEEMPRPQIEQQFFASGHWASSSDSWRTSYDTGRSSVSTAGSRMSIASDYYPLASPLASPVLGISRIGTTPDNAVPENLRSVASYTSLLSIALPGSPLLWSPLCRKVKVECKTIERVRGREKAACQAQECDIHWKYREDRSMVLRASYRSLPDGRAKAWSTQEFPAAGPSIPLTTTIDGKVSVHFPRGSFGKLDKRWADINYIFLNADSSQAFQTLLYTNNGKDAAELLFDRPIQTISSDKNRPECRGQNLRLWRRTEIHLRPDGPIRADVLVVLFCTNALEAKGHWVEEPHYAFQLLTERTYARSSDKLTLIYSKDPARWTLDKLFQDRRSSRRSDVSVTPRQNDFMDSPGIARSGKTELSASIRSSRTFFADQSGASSRMGNLNYFGYAKLDIEFSSIVDRSAFLDIWKKPLSPDIRHSNMSSASLLPIVLPESVSQWNNLYPKAESALAEPSLAIDADDSIELPSDNFPGANIFTDIDYALDEDWNIVQNQLPDTWKWDVEFHNGCWTCTPLELDTLEHYPLTIANSPVVIPVEYQWPPIGGVKPPPDPRPFVPIDCRAYLALEVVRDIFSTFEGSIGFYMLISGLLQIIVPEDFDTAWASSHLPHKYGNLNVSYISQTMEMTMLPSTMEERTKIKPSLSTQISSISSVFKHSRTTSHTLIPTLKLNDLVEARPKSKYRNDKYSGRIGMKVLRNGEPYVVMSTHIITEAIIAKSYHAALFGRGNDRFNKLDEDWNEHVEIWAGNSRIGKIDQCFDLEAEVYPNGFHHDIALVKPTSASSVKDIMSPIPGLGWLGRESWNLLRQQTSAVKILGPTEMHRSAKSLKCSRPSEILVVGEGIFLNQTAAAGNSKSLKDHDMSTWKNLVSRALLYRVYPDYDPPNGYSGVALYADGIRHDGTEGPGVVGFQSFVQRSGHVQNFNMEGSSLEKRLQLGRVAFSGAFEVPDGLKREYTIASCEPMSIG